ncbi:AraC family transcriptional regulator [soil metagenome]
MGTHAEFAQLWTVATPGIELFRAQLFQHKLGKHFHDAYVIGLNESGQGQCLHQQKTHCHYPGSFNLIDPGEVHTGEAASANGWGFRNIYISIPLVRHVLTQLDWPSHLPHFPDIVVNDPSLHAPFYRLFRVLNESPSSLEQQSLLLMFLSRLFSRHAQLKCCHREPKAEIRAVSVACDYLREHCTSAVSIEDLANLVDLNPYYLVRCFRQQVGISPHRYKQHWQLLAAKKALHSQQSLAAIALEHGFYDQSHFNRVFKQTFALPPGAYRKVNSVQDRAR